MSGRATEVIVNLQEIQIVLNLLGGELKVNYPVYGFGLFNTSPLSDGYKLQIICKDRDFDKELARFNEMAYEMPSFSDFRQCLISSGVLHYQNLNGFKKKLKAYKNLSKDIKFSLDTNLLYYKFITNYNLIKPSELVLVKTVGEEIEDKLNRKYRHHQIRELKKLSRYQSRLFDELWNRKLKISRKAAYVASREYKFIMAGVADELAEIKRPSSSKWDNDRMIVETLAKLEREGHVLPILLTADDALVDICNTNGLEYFKFDIPYIVDVEHCSPRLFVELLFNLAVIFGFIKINSVIIFGEFKGKSSNRPDELKLLFLDDKLYNDFNKELKICRRLMKLGIEK